MELFKASEQWAKRPADERFSTLEEMLAATQRYRDAACEANVQFSSLRLYAQAGNELTLRGESATPAKLTNWAFGQLCRRVGAPADYLSTLPADLVQNNLNHSLRNLETGKLANVLFHQNGGLVVRSIMTEMYERIWNADVIRQIIPLQAHGWKVPPARPAIANQPGTRIATPEDVCELKAESGLSIKVGDYIAPAGLYASDRDMFVFMVNERARINDGSECGLARGFFVENNEVGNGSYVIQKFLHRGVCGNHIVWGAQDVREFRFRHVGEATPERAFRKLEVELVKYANESVSDEQAKIAAARRYVLGKDKDDVIATARKLTSLSLKKLVGAYDLAIENEHVDGNPRSAYGFANGITRLSQLTPHAGERDTIDRAAGKVLEIAF